MPARGQLKTHCYMGYALEGTNLRLRVRTHGGKQYVMRGCKTCKQAIERQKYRE